MVKMTYYYDLLSRGKISALAFLIRKRGTAIVSLFLEDSSYHKGIQVGLPL